MRKYLIRKQVACLMALVMFCVSSISSVAFAEGLTEEIVDKGVTLNIQIVDRSGAVIDATSVTHAPTNGSITLYNNSGKRIKTVKFLGNKDGGGADSTVWLRSDDIQISRTYSINGEWNTIYSSSIGCTGNIYIEYTVYTPNVYNLVFMAFD